MMRAVFCLALVLMLGVASGFRTQETKKDPKRRRLDGDASCELKKDHLAAIDEEIMVKVWDTRFKGGQLYGGDSHFEVELINDADKEKYGDWRVLAWCIDYNRSIGEGEYSMDVFTAFDSDIPLDASNWRKQAVDKPEMLPNLAWLINNVAVGDSFDFTAESGNSECKKDSITWFELQGAVWWLIDHENGKDTPYEIYRNDCVAEYIAKMAETQGAGYEIDCTDPNEEVPVMMVVDDDSSGDIINQVIILELPLGDIPDPPTEAPTPAIDDKSSPTTLPPKTPAPSPASSSGDPHFKTWTGEKFDYHGECDLVLIDNPDFNNGQGLRLHVRTTRVKYFSYIERAALQIGEDILEFENDVETFLINGLPVEHNRKHHKTMLGGFIVRRDKKAISVRLHDLGRHDHQVTKIDFHTRKNGFPAVIVDSGSSDIFKGSKGLLGEWSTGLKIARDGETVIDEEDATNFALEWQVRDTEPMLFSDVRAPQYPVQCNPPKKMLGKRLGSKRMRKEAEKACAHWKEDKEDCIFDVIATRDVMVAAEGHIVSLK